MIDLAPRHLAEVRRILASHVPECEVRAYGSRVNGTARPWSDLDIALVAPEPIERKRLNRLEEALEESTLPFRVDVQEWRRISDAFQAVILNDYEVLPLHTQGASRD